MHNDPPDRRIDRDPGRVRVATSHAAGSASLTGCPLCNFAMLSGG